MGITAQPERNFGHFVDLRVNTFHLSLGTVS